MSRGSMFKGSFTALITPFRGDSVDEDAFARLVEWQIAEGTHGLVPCGTTGESPTLATDELAKVDAVAPIGGHRGGVEKLGHGMSQRRFMQGIQPGVTPQVSPRRCYPA